MPYCAIISCRSRNMPNSGIGFYRFPRKPRFRDKWLEVTGRKDWLPGKTSTICSKHFVEDDFLVTPCKDRKYLRSDAVPHIDVCRLVQNDKSDKLKNGATHAKSYATSKEQLRVEEDESDDDDDDEEERSSNEDDRASPSLTGESKQKLRRIIMTKSEVIKRQRATIQALRSQNRRFKAKIEKMEDVLNDLQKEILKWLPE